MAVAGEGIVRGDEEKRESITQEINCYSPWSSNWLIP